MAATIASAVVFSVLLIANAVLYSTQSDSLAAAQLTSVQLQERNYAPVLEGLAGFSALAQAETLLESTPMNCASTTAYQQALHGGGGLGGGTNRSVSYDVTWSWEYSESEQTAASPPASPAPRSPSSLLQGFDGPSPGDLDLLVNATLNETYLGGLPAYSTSATDEVHLPVQIDSYARACQGALADLNSSFDAGVGACNDSSLAQGLSAARARFPMSPSFQSGASASLAGGLCIVSYWVKTAQTGIPGVSGTFQWTVYGSGSLSVPVTAPPTISPAS